MAKRSFPSRLQVWKQQKECCYWCGRKTVFHKPESGSPTPPDMATVDHVYPNGHTRRREYKDLGKPSPFVMACSRCNLERGAINFNHFREIAVENYGSNTPNGEGLKKHPIVIKKDIVVIRNNEFNTRFKGFSRRRR